MNKIELLSEETVEERDKCVVVGWAIAGSSVNNQTEASSNINSQYGALSRSNMKNQYILQSISNMIDKYEDHDYISSRRKINKHQTEVI